LGDQARARLRRREQRSEERFQKRQHSGHPPTVAGEVQPRFDVGFRIQLATACLENRQMTFSPGQP
ncbi:MAG TPA: hypothetical protein VKT80_00625, partial [Chloroflexota bacterium]|nr:hypothetical protein [Chloroflexota bacterium]